MKVEPLVSVIIPAYNCEQYISSALSSVIDQSYTNIECLVIDDGSTDETAEKIKIFGDRVKYIFQENAGASAARNRGIELAKGDLIAFLDSDDIWVPHKIQAQTDVFKENPDLALICTDSFYLEVGSEVDRSSLSPEDFDRKKVEVSSDFTRIFLEPYLATSTVMVPAEIARNVGGFDTNLITAEDIDFYLNVCWGKSFAKIRQKMVIKNEVAGSLGDTPDTYRDNLDVIDKFLANHPEFEKSFGDVVSRQKTYIFQRWVEYLIYHGHGSNARSVMREYRYLKLDTSTKLQLKSYICNPLARIAGRYRKMVSRNG